VATPEEKRCWIFTFSDTKVHLSLAIICPQSANITGFIGIRMG